MKSGLALGSLLLLTATAAAQQQFGEPLPHPTESEPTPGYLDVMAALDGWQADHGANWKLRYEKRTQAGRFLFGGAAEPSFAPKRETDYYILAREFLAETYDMHRVDATTLVEDSVRFLPLGTVGSSDKMTVRFEQAVDGVPVLGGSVNVLFDTGGRLLSVDVQALPNLAGFSTNAGYGAAEARAAAAGYFEADAGVEPTLVDGGQLSIVMNEEGKFFEPRLVWDVNAQWMVEGFTEQGWHYRMDAASGEVVQREPSIHFIDVSGRVTSQTSPGSDPYDSGNSVNEDMPYITVTSPQGNAVADIDGNFTIVGATAPVDVTVEYEGTYAATDDNSGGDYSLTTTLNAATGNVITMNPGEAEFDTAEANAFRWIGLMREWTRTINPADPMSDFLAPANVNQSSTCNATWSGSAVNFRAEAGGCVNSSYSSVVLHEMGHWMNDRYGSGNGSDGFGEGNADVFSLYILDDPIIGKDFFGPGSEIRDAENANTYCGSGCYGQVHADGEVHMGALWNVRTNLKNTYGVAAGGTLASTLFNAWMNAYDDGTITPLNLEHWLTLDDDNGNIDDGTPNYDDINDGFVQQGFPSYVLPFVQISNVIEPTDTQSEVGPYTVQADLVAQFNPPLATATLYYRVNGGAFLQTSMTSVGGNSYAGDIPGQPSPAAVEWYIEAADSNANGNVYPDGAPGLLSKFEIGVKQIYYSEGFEGGVTGWTHGLTQNQDDWQYSAETGATNGSFGKAGDATFAYEGTQIYGNDLGSSSFNGFSWNGFYQDDTANWLRSPSIDLSAASNARLRFQRWLTIEDAVFDQAEVFVDGTRVWVNATGSDTIDTSWVEVDVDISAFDGDPDVTLEFRLTSDGGVNFGGWNIDAIEILSLEASGPGGRVTYCTAGTSASGCQASISSTGTASASAASGFVLTATNVEGAKDGLFFWGTSGRQANPWGNGSSYQCVVPPVKRGGLIAGSGTTATCTGVTAQDLNALWCAACPKPSKNPGAGALVQGQFWYRDPANTSNQSTSLSDAIEFTVAP